MDISITRFKAHCLDIIRKVEHGREPVDIKRRGKLVARLIPPPPGGANLEPWEKLRGTAVCLFEPGESVPSAEAIEAMR